MYKLLTMLWNFSLLQPTLLSRKILMKSSFVQSQMIFWHEQYWGIRQWDQERSTIPARTNETRGLGAVIDAGVEILKLKKTMECR